MFRKLTLKCQCMTEQHSFHHLQPWRGIVNAVKETARLTDEKIELTEEEISDLNQKLNFLNEHSAEQPEITVEYFVPDERKSGGAYITVSGNFRRIDEYSQIIIMTSGEGIPIKDIYVIKLIW